MYEVLGGYLFLTQVSYYVSREMVDLVTEKSNPGGGKSRRNLTRNWRVYIFGGQMLPGFSPWILVSATCAMQPTRGLHKNIAEATATQKSFRKNPHKTWCVCAQPARLGNNPSAAA